MMSLKNYRSLNQGINLDGVFFDDFDELGQHYEKKISIVPNDIKHLFLARKQNLSEINIEYTFMIIPDKSVIMKSYLMKYPGFNECYRDLVNAVSQLSFCLDTL